VMARGPFSNTAGNAVNKCRSSSITSAFAMPSM
jgi:hypothetical protein